jgi:hypothetical protein
VRAHRREALAEAEAAVARERAVEHDLALRARQPPPVGHLGAIDARLRRDALEREVEVRGPAADAHAHDPERSVGGAYAPGMGQGREVGSGT